MAHQILGEPLLVVKASIMTSPFPIASMIMRRVSQASLLAWVVVGVLILC